MIPHSESLLPRLRHASLRQRVDILKSHLQSQLQQVLGLAELPDADVGFFDLGIDSLKATELNTSLVRQLGDLPLCLTALFDYPTITRLAAHLADLLAVSPSVSPSKENRSAPPEAIANRMDHLTEQELDSLLEAHTRALAAFGGGDDE